MISFAYTLSLTLSQTLTERRITILGLAFFAAFMFFLIIDSALKQKLVPKSPVVRGFLIFLFLLAIVAFFAYIYL